MAMYRYMTLPVGPNRVLIVDGLDLLALCHTTMAAIGPGNTPEGSGTVDAPWLLRTADHWIGCFNGLYKAKMKAGDVYFNWAGRLIKGDKSYYFSDCGPVWRKGVAPQVGDTAIHTKATGHDAINPLYASTAHVGSQEALDRWKSIQINADPSYQKFAQRVTSPTDIFKEDPQFNYADGPWRNTWATVQANPMIAKFIRDIMAHRPLSLFTQSGGHNRHYARLQHMLPNLIGAMFLAEPLRNPRAWIINMMLLDLADSGHAVRIHGRDVTWDTILWHPEALEVSRARPGTKDTPVQSKVLGPILDKRGIGPVTTIGKLHSVGGLMPASPTGGGKYGKGHPKQADFVHLREVEVLLTWLSLRTAGSRRFGSSDLDASDCVPGRAVADPLKHAPTEYRGALLQARQLIENRAKSLDRVP